MKLLWLVVVFLLQAVSSSAFDGETQNVHSNSFITEIIVSEVLDENRPISIYIPKSYTSSDASYPVLYLLDGKEHIFHVAGLVDYLVSVGRIPELIIVGIHSTDRYRDYTPNVIEHHVGTGGALTFTKFLTDELFSHIESTYRTRPFRIIFGHSYGGTYVTNIFLNNRTLFGGYIAASPNLLVLDDVVAQFKAKFVDQDKGREKMFLTVGEHEPDFIAIASDLEGHISKDPLARFLWNYRVLPQDNHASTPHKTIYFGLEAIFQEFWHFSSETDGASLVEQFQVLSDRLGYDMVVPLSVLVSLGNSALGSERLDQAQSIFELLIQSYPESEWGYVSLGSVHYSKGDNNKARVYFNKAMGINPDNPYTKDMLRTLAE